MRTLIIRFKGIRAILIPTSLALLVIGLIIASNHLARAQESFPVPTFGTLTGPPTQNPDTLIFDPMTVVASFRVDLQELQSLIDAMAPGQFVAIPRADDPTTGTVTITIPWQRTTSNTGGPFSRLAFFVGAREPQVNNRTVTLVIGIYDNNAAQTNNFLGANVAVQSEIKWKIEEKKGETTYKVDISNEEDQMTFHGEWTVPNVLGDLVITDPAVPVQFWVISDGPNGSHSRFINSSQRYDVLASRSNASVTFNFPFGTLNSQGVISASLRRDAFIVLKKN